MREVTARLAEAHRIGEETGEGYPALAAAVIVQAMGDAAHGVRGSSSDPELAQGWLASSGREWLETLRLAAGGGMRARRVA